jgi:uncharacterized membrane protein
MKLESKTGHIPFPAERIYNFLSNFNNFSHLVPADKIQNWKADESSCSFSLPRLGQTGVKIIEKEPNKLIKLTSIDESSVIFTCWIQLKSMDQKKTIIRLTMEAGLNSMLEVMARKPLQEFLNKLVDQLEKYTF